MKPDTLILASKSPRRLEILQRMGLHATVRAFETDETVDPALGLTPSQTVQLLAERKARAARDAIGGENAAGQGRCLIIAADTVVALGDRILGKPRDEADAFDMLRALSGTTHRVLTGMAVCDAAGGAIAADVSKSTVRFRKLSDAEIRAYIATKEPMDKAGAYAIQQRGALFAEHIEGDFFGIMGLSVSTLDRLLRDHFAYDILAGNPHGENRG